MSIDRRTRPVDWVVYSRPGCGLCEAFMLELAGLLDPDTGARVVVVNVENDEQLKVKYGDRIPVLLADGDFVCAYRLDVARLKRYLEN